MSDNEESQPSAEPAPSLDAGDGVEAAARREPGYRVVELRFGADGGVRAATRHFLTEKVYSRSVAIRYATHEAKRSSGDELWVLVNPSGRVILAVHAGSARPVRTVTMLQVRRTIRAMLPDGGARKRRTSRPASPRATKPSSPSAKRRTSRR